jgi:hypothetical protein
MGAPFVRNLVVKETVFVETQLKIIRCLPMLLGTCTARPRVSEVLDPVHLSDSYLSNPLAFSPIFLLGHLRKV